jgi:hypothetical protein
VPGTAQLQKRHSYMLITACAKLPHTKMPI